MAFATVERRRDERRIENEFIRISDGRLRCLASGLQHLLLEVLLMAEPFLNRREAGRDLASHLRHYGGRDDVIVLALPRGGVPVGFEVAERLGAPLDVFLVRKLGVPGHEELAMGAIASGGVRVLNEHVVRMLGISPSDIDEVAALEQAELERREREYRGERAQPDMREKVCILVDDGLATGATMRAAAEALRRLGPAKVVVAVPAAAAETCEEFRHEVDEIVCAQTPEPFIAVGAWYVDFSPTSDEEVRELLVRAQRRKGMSGIKQTVA